MAVSTPRRAPPALPPIRPLFNRETMPPIRPDLIPATSWGSSLANMLTKPAWDSIRLPAIHARNRACQICGTRTGWMECHEIWAYSMPPKELVMSMPDGEIAVGIQRLIGLASLCKRHHAMFHSGFARTQGNYDAVKADIMAVNRWDVAEFSAFETMQAFLYKVRSSVYWGLDLSLVGDGKPLEIKSGWTMTDDGYLKSTGKWENVTTLFGAPFVHSGKLFPAVDPTQAMEGNMPEEGDFDFVRSMGNGVNSDVPANPAPIQRSTRQAAEEFAARSPELLADTERMARLHQIKLTETLDEDHSVIRTPSGTTARFIHEDEVSDYVAELMEGAVSVTYRAAPVWSDSRAPAAEPAPPPRHPKPGLLRRWFGR